ncbi:MAG: ABC transporter ATP-binding protein [Pseudomonadota bacterium]
MLEVRGVSAGYGPVQVLHEVDLYARTGEVLCLMGRNGAGKTTMLKAIMGLVTPTSGEVRLNGEAISALPAHEAPRKGVGYIPQGRRLFTEMTVAENIEVGLMTRRRGAPTRDRVLGMFPRLAERLDQRAETLSGGEQQMLATARALCLEPEVMLLDEPTEGLQPSMIQLIRDSIAAMRADGVAVVLVEQRVEAALALADRIAFLENGRTREVISVAEARADRTLLDRYIGV